MRSGTGGWTMGCNCDPGRPAPPICEVSGAGLPYRRFEPRFSDAATGSNGRYQSNDKSKCITSSRVPSFVYKATAGSSP